MTVRVYHTNEGVPYSEPVRHVPPFPLAEYVPPADPPANKPPITFAPIPPRPPAPTPQMPHVIREPLAE